MSDFSSDSTETGAQARARWVAEACQLAHLEAGGAAPLRLSETSWVGRLPDWLTEAPHVRAERALLAGVVCCAGVLRRTIDGRILRPLADRLGPDRLSAAMSIRGKIAEPEAWVWDADPVEALTGLGGELLLREAALPLAFTQRLAALFPPSQRLACCDAESIRETFRIAQTLWQSGVSIEERAA